MALLAAGFFGVATPFSKTLLADLQANQLAGLLYLGAAVCLFPFILKRKCAGSVIFPKDRRNQYNLLGAILFGGIIGPVLLLIGLKYSLAASVSMWLNLESVATAVIAFFLFREHMGKWTWLGNIGVVAAGILLSFNEGWSGWIGLLCVSGAAIAWGLDNNFTAVIDSISPEDSTFWKGLIAGFVNLTIGMSFFPLTIDSAWLWALLLGGLSYGLSITLYIRSAQSLGATRAQMIFASSPLFGVLLSIIWLKEGISLIQVVSALILTGSISLIFADRHEHAHKHDPLFHDHEHRHDDKHHEHEHSDQVSSFHSHPHEHEAAIHTHPHWPDLHHRHHNS